MNSAMSAMKVGLSQVVTDLQFNAIPAMSSTTLLLRSDKFLHSIQPQ